jgi:hypothetical protein
MHNPPMTWGRRLFLVGAAAAALIGCGSATDNRPAKWSFISAAIIEPSCATANCHSLIAQRASVDLHDRATGYASLVSRNFVVPCDPATMNCTPTATPCNQTGASAVIYLMCGLGSLRMPPDNPLPEADIKLIDDWIKAGASPTD